MASCHIVGDEVKRADVMLSLHRDAYKVTSGVSEMGRQSGGDMSFVGRTPRILLLLLLHAISCTGHILVTCPLHHLFTKS